MKLTCLAASALSAMMVSPSPASAQSPLRLDLSGSVHIQLDVPCGDPLDLNLTIQAGRMEVTPRSVTRNERLFDLTRLDLFVTPFSVHRECMGLSATAEFREIGVQMAGAQRFTGEETGPVGSGLYRIVIPKEQFLFYETVLDNGPGRQPKAAYHHPDEDVTGLISLDPRRQFVQLHVVFTEQLHFQTGCVRGGHCAINEKHDATITSDLLAVTDTGLTPPAVSCTAVRGNTFRASADDASGTPTIRLGIFVLANGEVFQLQHSRLPGVRLIDTTRGGLRQFQAGPGDDVVIATSDASGLSAIAFCQ
jgi:hypothetical protein